jgi:hypothetical protein
MPSQTPQAARVRFPLVGGVVLEALALEFGDVFGQQADGVEGGADEQDGLREGGGGGRGGGC